MYIREKKWQTFQCNDLNWSTMNEQFLIKPITFWVIILSTRNSLWHDALWILKWMKVGKKLERGRKNMECIDRLWLPKAFFRTIGLFICRTTIGNKVSLQFHVSQGNCAQRNSGGTIMAGVNKRGKLFTDFPRPTDYPDSLKILLLIF